VFMVLF